MKNLALILLAAVIAMGCESTDRDSSTSTEATLILVTGATGTQGGAVARELRRRGFAVRGLTRNPGSDRAKAMSMLGVEMVQGDFDDAQSLAAAMRGAYGVFAVTDFWEHGYDTEVKHGKQLIDAARIAAVQHFVFTSVASAHRGTGIPHFDSKGEIEIELRESGIGFSIVRPVEFMDNIRFSRDSILSGVYSDPRPASRSHQWIAASDIGYLVGEAFDKPNEWLGQAVDIAGDQLTIAELVGVLSRTTGTQVTHQQISWRDYEDGSGAQMTQMLRWFDNTGYQADVAALRAQHPNLLTFDQYLQRLEWN